MVSSPVPFPARAGWLLRAALVTGVLSAGPAAQAGANQYAALGLHIADVQGKNACPDFDETAATLRTRDGTDCQAGLTRLVYVFVCNGSDSAGVAGVEFGLEADAGISPDSWTLCADLQFAQPGFPAPGTGNLVTWDPLFHCQATNSEPFVPDTVIAVAGYLTVSVTDAGLLELGPRPASGVLGVSDCQSVVDELVCASYAGFCTRYGFNACGSYCAIPVQPSTWGGIKSLFGN